MKKVEVTLQKKGGAITVDFGGDLDGACCGKEARLLDEDLKELGVETELQGIFCRLIPFQRFAAKQEGQCIVVNRLEDQASDTNFLTSEEEYVKEAA